MQEQALLKNKYSCYLVKKERIKILMSKASLYAQHESLSKQIVSQLPFALKSTDGETESTYLSILKEHGITLNIQFLSNAIPTMINLIAKGSAYAFTTDSTFSEMPKKQTLCAVPIKGNIDVYTFLLIRNEPTPIAKRFFEIFQSSHKLPEKLF